MNHLAAGLFGLGTGELIVILVIILILFGPKQLPKLGKMLGQGIKDFRDSTKKGSDEEPVDDEPVQARSRDRISPSAGGTKSTTTPRANPESVPRDQD